jgi:hypothetical protein
LIKESALARASTNLYAYETAWDFLFDHGLRGVVT